MAGLNPVTGPDWWNERRYGMFVHAGISTVASFSPIGESASWYWNHLGSDALPDAADRTVAGAPRHPSPMAEVLAYHGDRWAHVETYDDFIPFLSYHRFDADDHAELAVASGMRYLVHLVKDHDGFCWWDAPGTTRTSVEQGPGRDVVAELSAACRRHDIVFGTAYSLLDWSDLRYPGAQYVEQVLHPQVLDLVERYGSQIMWGDGAWGHGADVWRSAELIETAKDLADAQGFELAVNDQWQLSAADFATVEHRPPADIVTGRWELRRPLGSSFGYNRAESAEHLLSPGALFDLLTEVVAKGGNLLIDVGPGVDGTISELQQHPLRVVGAWVNDHADIIHAGAPFDQWGDAQIRYVVVGGDVVALDLAAGMEIVLAGLTPDRYDVSTVVADDGGALHWEQHRGGVTISRIDHSPQGLAGVYRIGLRPVAEAIRLFDERDAVPLPLQPLLDAAVSGTVVQLRDGAYRGPVVVPPGVTLRGLGWDRTTIVSDVEPAVRLSDDARLENVHVPSITIDGGGAAIVGCRCDGRVEVHNDDVDVRSLIGTTIEVHGERSTVERCALRGSQADVGISIVGGSGHRVTRNEVVDHLCGIRLADANASTVTENRLESRSWGVHVLRCDHVEIADNSVQHTMRAVDIDGGNGSVVTGNWMADGDSGALVQFGATDTAVLDNHVERCRIGILVWDAPTTQLGPNTFVDIHEEEPCVFGPDSDVDAS
jgi:alpha-L-fucosidase